MGVPGLLGSLVALTLLSWGSTDGGCVQVAGQGIDAGLTRSLEAFQDAVLLCDSQTEWQVVFANSPARRHLSERLA